jgi:thiamine biosynthesis lipoprotein
MPPDPIQAQNDLPTVELTAEPGAQVFEERAAIMGTEVSILIMDETEQTARRAMRAAFDEVRRIDALMTDWRSSPFEEINQQAGIAPVAVSDEILFMVQEAIRISKLTDGSFDISYAGAGRLWDFKKSPPALPGEQEIRESLKLVGYSNIRVNAAEKTVFLPLEGMRIGLGGIAKGYSVDRAAQTIKESGIKNFAVNAGGDLTVRGKRGGKLWWVGIRHPRNKTENIALLPISNGTVVTSGDNERFFVVDGVRYCHILNPKTGYPANQCQSVTLIARTTYLGDALATSVFVMGPARGMQFIESQAHLEGMIVDADGRIHVSSGLQKSGNPGARTL